MGGGKSHTLRWAALLYLIYLWKTTKIKDIPVGLFSEDYPTLKDRQISRIEREFPAWLGQLKDDNIFGLSFHVRDDIGGGKILLRNLDDPSKYMSTEFAGEFVDELTRDALQTFEDLRNRLRYPGIDQVKFMGATNPGGIGHGWVKKYFIDKNSGDSEQDRFFYVHANAYDNKYISPEYIKQLESLPSQQRKAYLEGSWDIFAGQYFTEITDKHRIQPFVPSYAPIVGGMDWGRANPFSFHLATLQKIEWRDDKNETAPFYRVKTFFEVYGKEKNPDEWSEIIKDQMLKRFNLTLSDLVDMGAWVRCDSMIFAKGDDNSKSIFDQFKDADSRWGFILKPAIKGPDSRIRGWQNMHTWLSLAPDGLPYWQWTTNCEALDRTLPQLIHDENNIEDVESSRKGGIDDDCGDDQRYMLQHITFMDGFTGQIKSKRDAIPLTREQRLAHVWNEEAIKGIDVDKFVPKKNRLL
jgi:hypothetical protein